jgi:hypothetical protein
VASKWEGDGSQGPEALVPLAPWRRSSALDSIPQHVSIGLQNVITKDSPQYANSGLVCAVMLMLHLGLPIDVDIVIYHSVKKCHKQEHN